MTATLLPPGKQTFLDGNGDPLASGSVYFYVPGTSTPKNTWQDAAQTTLNANPVVLDSSGTAIIYGQGQYRQVVQDSNGNTIWDQLTADTNSFPYGTSTTSLLIGTGTKSFTTQTGLNFIAGMTVTASSQADPTNFMAGIVSSYTASTGVLVLTSSSIGGSGTFSDWRLMASGPAGPQGPQGPSGGAAPTGSVILFAAVSAPTGFLVCDGSAVSRSTYSTLFGVIGTVWGAGDGTTTFNLPDLRGYFPRGWDDSAGIDPGRVFASTQTAAFASHSHTITDSGHTHTLTDPGHHHTVPSGNVSGVGAPQTSAGAGTQSTSTVTTGITVNSATTGITGTDSTGGVETRPINVAINFCIKT